MLKYKLGLPTLRRLMCTAQTQIETQEQVGKPPLRLQDLPAPVGLPLIGTALSMLAACSTYSVHKYLDSRHKELGSIFRDSVGPVDAVFISNPDVMRNIFTRHEGKYPVHLLPDPWVVYGKKHDCKRGVFFMDGEEWLETRRILNKILLKPNSESWIQEPILQVADNFVLELKNKCSRSGYVPDLEKELYRQSLDVILSAMLGTAYLSSRHQFDDLLTRFSEKVHGIFKYSSKMAFLPATVYEKWNLPAWKHFTEAIESSLKYGEQLVDTVYSLEDIGNGMTSRLIAEGMSKSLITRVLIDFIIAAGDTTAFTTQWALYLLSKNPEIIREIQSTPENSEAEQNLVKGVIKETMRLYPAAAFLTRFLASDAEIGGYTLPAKTLLIMSIYTSGRNSQYFPNPLEFSPKRWSKIDNSLTGVISPHASIPFAMGARSCIGRKIAMTQMRYSITKILRNFNLRLLNNKPVDDLMQMILKPKTKINILFTPK